eukprot:g4103.t1
MSMPRARPRGIPPPIPPRGRGRPPPMIKPRGMAPRPPPPRLINNIITERPFRPPSQPPDFSGVILFTNGEPVAMYNSGGE